MPRGPWHGATCMDLEIITLSEGQTEKYKYHMILISLICGIPKIMTQLNLFTKEKQTHRQKISLWLRQGKAGEGMIYEFWINKYTLLYIK